MILRTVLRSLSLGLVFLVAACQSGGAELSASDNEPRHCGMLPPAVSEAQTYAGFSACWLHSLGERPLWRDSISPNYRQQVRFTFTEGHMRYARVVNFVETPDGAGLLEVMTITRKSRRHLTVSDRRRVQVSSEDVHKLNALAEASGAWRLANGTWDGEDIYLHCQTLDMEQVDQAGYRFSNVNISCHHPQKLMPLVEHLTALAGLKVEEGLY